MCRLLMQVCSWPAILGIMHAVDCRSAKLLPQWLLWLASCIAKESALLRLFQMRALPYFQVLYMLSEAMLMCRRGRDCRALLAHSPCMLALC